MTICFRFTLGPFVVPFLLCSSVLISCQTPSPDPVLPAPPVQRVAALTVSSLGQFSTNTVFRMVTIAGTAYPVSAVDSLHFQYDSQRRLIRKDLTQSIQYYPDKSATITGSRSEYRYDGTSLLEQEGISPYWSGRSFRFPLDSTRQRVLSYTKTGYSFVAFDSLRRYSGEGILTSALQTYYNPGYPLTERREPNTNATVEAGNVTRLEEYDPTSGKLTRLTRFYYDNKHYAPLAIITFLGEASRNALLKKTILDYSYAGGVVTEEHTYTSEYDAQGRMTRQVEYSLDQHTNQVRPSSLIAYFY